VTGARSGRRLLGGLALSTGSAAAAYRQGSLSPSGAAGAILVGTSTFLGGGMRWSAVLLAFFASSSALSRIERRSSAGKEIAAFTQRGARRDLTQALANGGVASLVALGQALRPHAALEGAFAGAYAAAAADTWATEIGALSPTPPRHILSGAPVPAGTSGGVTATGLAGAALGSFAIGLVTAITNRERAIHLFASTALAGITGSLVDSLAGATLQAAYWCPSCRKATERRVHTCGATTILVRGHAWCTNDLVNVLCTVSGAGMGALFTWGPEEA
jgi:uncharacterized protein (TIGR00297 family)